MTCRSWAGDRFGVGLVDVRTPVGVGLADLIEIGLRRNPRRAQLLVSTVLGKHLAVDPRVAAGFGRLLGALVARRLAGQDETPPPTWSAAARSTIRGVQPGALLDLTLDLAAVDLAAVDLAAVDLATVDLAAGTGADHSGVLVLGFAETATALGHLVADQLPGAAYLHSTRRRVPGMTVSAEFSEPHSHAVGHLLSPRTPSLLAGQGAVVLVDDELSTGRTALNVITELQAIRPRSRYVLAGLVDVRSTADDRTRAEVAHRLGCRIDVVSLVAGRIELPTDLVERVAQEFGDGSDRSVVLPVGAPAEPCRIEPRHIEPCRIDLPWPADVPTGGRHGVLPDQRPGFDRALRTAAAVVAQACGPARRVLVVGSEELMYLPLRIALDLAENPPDGEPAGRRVTFQSTTRSPVHAVDQPGYPVRRRIDFVGDDAGTAVTRHLYNAGHPDAGHPDAADSDAGDHDAAEHEAGQRADLIVVIDEGDARPGADGVAAAIAAATGADVVLCGLPA